MKTNLDTRHEHVPRTLFLVLFTLAIAGVFCWLLLNPRPAPIAPATAPTLLRLRSGLSAMSVVLVPAPGRVPILPSGPVAGAVDATTRAVMAANGTALSNYGVEPFADAKPTATFDGRRWSWRKRVGYGMGDLEAEVTIAPNGTVESVTVRYTTQQFAQRADRK